MGAEVTVIGRAAGGPLGPEGVWRARPLRLLWGALAVLVIAGVLAMHALAGGQHAGHADVSADGDASIVQEHVEPARAAAADDLDRAVLQACDGGACAARRGGALCLALLYGAMLVVLRRGERAWPLRQDSIGWSMPRARTAPRPMTPAPVVLGICRT